LIMNRKRVSLTALLVLFVLVTAVAISGCGKKKASAKKSEGKSTEATTEAVDNSVPITEFTVTAPSNHMRVGDEFPLDIRILPEDATNTKLEWTIKDADTADSENESQPAEETTGQDVQAEATETGESGAAEAGESRAAEYIEITSDGKLVAEEGAEKHNVVITAKTTDGSNLEQSFTLRIYPEIDPDQPMVAVTFDDGPNPSTTNVMLDALEENYAKATFFVLGTAVNNYPETVKREYDLGMEVGTHTTSHSELTKLSGSALDKEVSDSVKSIEKADGVKPNLMRPPYGAYNDEVLAVAKSYDLCCVNWSLDTEDWKTKNADDTYRMVMTATDGDVILLHDIHEYNVKAVQRFVPDLIDAGFQLVTVPELYAARGETLKPGTIHFRTDPTTEKTEETTEAAYNEEEDELLNDNEDLEE